MHGHYFIKILLWTSHLNYEYLVRVRTDILGLQKLEDGPLTLQKLNINIPFEWNNLNALSKLCFFGPWNDPQKWEQKSFRNAFWMENKSSATISCSVKLNEVSKLLRCKDCFQIIKHFTGYINILKQFLGQTILNKITLEACS